MSRRACVAPAPHLRYGLGVRDRERTLPLDFGPTPGGGPQSPRPDTATQPQMQTSTQPQMQTSTQPQTQPQTQTPEPQPKPEPPPPGPPPRPQPEPQPKPPPSPPQKAPPQAPPEPAPRPQAPRPLTVAELDRAIKGSLDASFERPLWVEGEVTGARPVTSGHLYFCLKDGSEDAAIDVAMYKTTITPRARALIRDGARVRLRGRPTFWAPRGKLQFIADRADAAGRGAILEALERLKEKLAAEGLFAAERKRALPREPRTIGVVSSARGAVIHDICKVAFRRGGAHLLLAPATVQGDGAAESILRALRVLARVRDVDVILLARGGGSSDELMAFNDEALVRAVAACRVPVVSAVGHEVDVTLCDFAADARAATPSQAAEMVVPDARARSVLLAERRARLARAMRQALSDMRARQARLVARMGDPRLAIASRQQLLDERTARLSAQHPRAVIARERVQISRAGERMHAAMHARLTRHASAAHALAARLDAMSPLKVLGRGYAIATHEDGRAIRRAAEVVVGEPIRVRLGEGQLTAEVRARDEE